MSTVTAAVPRSAAPLYGLVLASVALATARAYAQPGSACADSRLRVEGSLSARWLEPVVQLCESLASMRDVDPSAALRVVAAGDDVIIEVSLHDGRSTLRRVHVPSELALTVEALVTVPPEAPPTEVRAPLTVVRRTQDAVPAPPSRRFSLEVGAGVMVRIAGGPIYPSIGAAAYAGIRTGPWLLALAARYDGFQTVNDDRPRDFEMTTAGGGFTLLRELLSVERGVLEAGVSTWLLGETQAYTPNEVELTFATIDTRLGAIVRWVVGVRPL
ncbi:MAG TPA: hypothetical protein VI299_13515, partial [Polyangiales bacterium]